MRITRYVGPDGCDDPLYLAELTAAAGAVIDTVSPQRNVTVKARLDDRPLRFEFSDELRDFIDVAAAVYVGDQLERRAAQDDTWTREFQHTVPVSDPEMWRRGDLLLRQTLHFLAGDRFMFRWIQRAALPAGRQSRTVLPEGFDVVCLFSGGMDSLLGAYSLLSQGRKVLLVGHQAEGITAAAQKSLADELRMLFPNRTSLMQCRVARSKNDTPLYPLPKKIEETHRPRSFLFLALAIAVARATGIEEVFIPENGLIALNPPLQKNRVGTLSTRTAHPIYVSRLLDFLHTTGLFAGQIRNPFLYQSKTDMLRSLPPALRGLMTRSVSCSRASRYQDRGVRHCGYCVPCIYRRAAMIAAGLDEPSEYAFDFLTELPRMTGHKQADVRAVAAFAQRVRQASDMELQMLVLSHGFFPAEIGGHIGPSPTTDYTPWVQMLRRWAQDFLTDVQPRCVAAVWDMLAIPALATRSSAV